MKTRNVVALTALGLASVAVPVGYIAGLRNSKLDDLRPIVRESTGDVYIDSLISKLSDKDRDVRYKVAMELGQIKNPIVKDALIVALKDVDAAVRTESAYALGNIKSKDAVQPLIEHLYDLDSSVISAAAYSLGEIGDKAATST